MAAGVLDVWGRVGEVTPPHLVLPLTVEPSKPRLCHDERYLNLWIRDLPFRLDHLPHFPRYVLPGHFQTSFDDKSGYQHLLLHPSSRTYFDLKWNDVYFVFRISYFVPYHLAERRVPLSNHNLGLFVSGAARSFVVPVSQYIDDRHVGQLFRSPACASLVPSKVLAEAAAYIMCYLLIEGGYFMGIRRKVAVGCVHSSSLSWFLVRFLAPSSPATRR